MTSFLTYPFMEECIASKPKQASLQLKKKIHFDNKTNLDAVSPLHIILSIYDVIGPDVPLLTRLMCCKWNIGIVTL